MAAQQHVASPTCHAESLGESSPLLGAPTLGVPSPVRQRRAVIISASVGSGHDTVASIYATQLSAKGFTVVRHDYIDSAPWLARMMLKHWYEPQVQNAPENFTWMIQMLQRPTWVWYIIMATCWLSLPSVYLWTRGADVVVSTYPMSSQCLGIMRQWGWLHVKAITHLVDPGFHRLWFHEGVDVHLGSVKVVRDEGREKGFQCEQVQLMVQDSFWHSCGVDVISPISSRSSRFLDKDGNDDAVSVGGSSTSAGTPHGLGAESPYSISSASSSAGDNDDSDDRETDEQRIAAFHAATQEEQPSQLVDLMTREAMTQEQQPLPELLVHPASPLSPFHPLLARPRIITVVITSGSLGLGTILDTVRAVASQPFTRSMVLCGRNEWLAKTLRAQYPPSRVWPLGWTVDVSPILSRADVAVHTASYMTEEMRAVGAPLVTFNPLPGHGLLNAAALEREGLSPWPKTRKELAQVLERVAETQVRRHDGAYQWVDGEWGVELRNTTCSETSRRPADWDQASRLVASLASGDQEAAEDGARWGTQFGASFLMVLFSLLAFIFYVATCMGWGPVVLWIRLPRWALVLYWLRAMAALSSLGFSITIGLFVGLYWQLVDPTHAPHGMTVAAGIFLFFMRHLVGLSTEVEGFEHLEGLGNKPAVLVLNHQSEMDLLVIGALFQRLEQGVVVAKKSLKLAPLLGWFMSATGAMFVTRNRQRSASSSSAQGTDAASATPPESLGSASDSTSPPLLRSVSSGDSSSNNAATAELRRQLLELLRTVVIFPEGTRSYSAGPSLLPFKTGSFFAAAAAGVPIVPVVVENYSDMYHAPSRRFGSGLVRVRILEPRRMDSVGDGGGDTEAIQKARDEVHEEMREMLVELWNERQSW